MTSKFANMSDPQNQDDEPEDEYEDEGHEDLDQHEQRMETLEEARGRRCGWGEG